MMGLFSCVFVKAPLRHRVRNVNTGELKRGMGGLHGNKVFTLQISGSYEFSDQI